MPNGPFLESARGFRYDIELLERRFGASFEQVCHRLTTLRRPGQEGVPFHFVRVDIAGNISERFGLGDPVRALLGPLPALERPQRVHGARHRAHSDLAHARWNGVSLHRAHRAAEHGLGIDENVRGVSFYRFVEPGGKQI